MKAFITILSILGITFTASAIDRQQLFAYDTELTNIFTQLHKEVSPIVAADWGQKFNYWGDIHYTGNPNRYLPENIKALCTRYVGVEMGKTAEIYRYAQRIALQPEDKEFIGKQRTLIEKTTLFVPDFIQSITDQGVARLAIQKFILKHPEYVFRAGKIYLRQKEIAIYNNKGPGICVQVLDSTQDIHQYPDNVTGAMGTRVSQFNKSSFWGWLALLSKRNFKSTERIVLDLFPSCPYAKFQNPQDTIAAWALIADHTAVVTGKTYTVEIFELK